MDGGWVGRDHDRPCGFVNEDNRNYVRCCRRGYVSPRREQSLTKLLDAYAIHMFFNEDLDYA